MYCTTLQVTQFLDLEIIRKFSSVAQILKPSQKCNSGLQIELKLVIEKHRKLILEGKCEKAPGQKINHYNYLLAECIGLRPVQATRIHLVDSISVHSNITQHTVLPTERVIVYFLPRSYIAKLSIYHCNFHISPLVMCSL